MRLLDLMLKDLRQIAREKLSFVFLLVMPIMFTVLFGFAFGGFDSDDETDLRLPVALLDLDEGAAGGHFTELLERSAVVRIEKTEEAAAELEKQLQDGDWAAVLTIPANYSRMSERSDAVPIDLLMDDGTTTGFTVQQAVEAAAGKLNHAMLTARISSERAVEQGVIVAGPAQQSYFEQAVVRAISAWEEPPVEVNSFDSTAWDPAESAVYSDNAFAHSSPGMMAQFSIAGLMIASQILVLERKNGCLRRLLTSNLSRPEILFGHFLAMFIMIMVQLLILILFGQLFLRLPYFREPLATLLLTVSTGLFAASLGLLLGSLAKSEEQAMIFSLIPMFILAGLGGAWVPLEFTPETFQRIAYFTPIAWMVDGYKDIVVRGLGLESVLTGTAVLLIYALVFWILGAWRFRYE